LLVVPDAKALALYLNNPSRVRALLPNAKLLEAEGKQLTVVPHGLHEVWGLRSLGIRAPSPILHYYDWPGQFTPYEHQKMTASFLTMHPRCLVLNEIGTGKTQSALWAADYLIREGVVRKVLILSPLSTLERVWGDAVFKDFLHRNAVVLYGTAEKRKKLLKTDADFYVINHDGFPIIAKQASGMFDLVIVDEAAVLRNAGTNRYKSFKRWLDQQENIRLWLMTGTPTPNEPTDAWALAKLVNNPFVAPTLTAFRSQVMQKVGQWKFIPRPDSADTVKHVLQPAVRYTRDQCFDLPDTITQARTVDLTAQQKSYYKDMLKQFVVQAASGDVISAVNEAVKLQKLVQIACGVAYSEDSTPVELDCSPRINVLKDVIEEAGEKVIVFVPLTGVLNMLQRELSKRWTVGVVNGDVTAKKRNAIFHNFQHEADPHILLAHPATMSHGLTLTAASTIVWYGPITSNEQYVQANGRVERIGKRTVSNVVHIDCSSLERSMYARLGSKQKMQGLLLDLIQREME